MSTDGGLPEIFMRRFVGVADAQRIETGGTGRGIPDINYCFPQIPAVHGGEGWLECKFTRTNVIDIKPEQIAWAERRARFGGRVFLAVRQSQRIKKQDLLWLLGPHQLRLRRLKDDHALGCWDGGPAKWNWDEIFAVLRQ